MTLRGLAVQAARLAKAGCSAGRSCGAGKMPFAGASRGFGTFNDLKGAPIVNKSSTGLSSSLDCAAFNLMSTSCCSLCGRASECELDEELHDCHM